jgi:GMP synthase (glutamine-hydrolysing)
MSAQPAVAKGGAQSSSKHQAVVIIDYGSQYTQLITRRVRELGIYSVVVAADSTVERLRALSPRAVILSGGPNSVYEDGAPTLPAGFAEFQKQAALPTLGVCYGMQLLARELGGEVRKARVREYGRMEVKPERVSHLFAGELSRPFQAWMSHGDETERVPEGFVPSACSAAGGITAMENVSAKLYGLQFHPEVAHTERGKEILKRFLLEIAGVKPDWTMGSVLEEEIAKIRTLVGPDQHVILGLSGGVDSTVAATLVQKAIGDRLHCFFVDHGLLRFRERERVMKMFEDRLHLNVTCIDAADRFLDQLAGVTDPERKRKIIGAQFIEEFERAASQIAQKIDHTPEFLVQGTLYPDVIESSPAPSISGATTGGKKLSHTIKSHHNVGGLPANLRFKLIEPLRDLFKDEVREMGRVLGVPDEFLKRHPFPGPGLAVRMIGEITREQLEILKHADEIFIESIREFGLYDVIWQAFAVFLPIRTVGVQGDGRTHDHVVALRAVTSSDGMTADWYPFDPKFLAHVSSRICNEVRGVNRVVYDVSSKPPATIEWE